MRTKKFLYLLYKRVRPGFGIPFGFILMYGLFSSSFSPPLFAAAAGFLFIEIYGGLYNDYWDYDDDIRNGRKDKFTTCGFLSRKQARNLSFLIASVALVLLWFTNIIVFALGVYYMVLFIFYSNPFARLKGSVRGYATLASAFLFLPLALGSLSGTALSVPALLFSSFYFFQFMYILCQKDSTDTKDGTNLFIRHGWEKSTRITTLFGTLASVSLLFLSVTGLHFIFFWALNLAAKVLNINGIRLKTITKTRRYRTILVEFLTPYLYLGGGVFA